MIFLIIMDLKIILLIIFNRNNKIGFKMYILKIKYFTTRMIYQNIEVFSLKDRILLKI